MAKNMDDFVATQNFVIFREDKDEFLSAIDEGEEANVLYWCPLPGEAKNYSSAEAAIEEAQQIADNQGYDLVICEIHESETQLALEEVFKVESQQSAELN